MKKRARYDKQQPPAPIADALASYLAQSGLAPRVEQAAVVPEWPALVGAQIAAVTEPLSVTQDGVLWVAVATHGWMAELSLLEPELLRKLNVSGASARVERIRWVLRK